MGQAPSSPPLVEVSYDQLTYEALQKEAKKEMFTYQPNRPSGLEQRIGADLFGLVLLYAATFVACDVMRAMITGHWTRIYWMFLGPWNYVTGSPLLHRFTDVFDTRGPGTLTHCEDAYELAMKKCDLEYVTGSGSQCHAQATADYQACYENSPECQTCESNYKNEMPWGKTVCDTLENGYEWCQTFPPQPSDTEITIHCLGELGYDPQ